MNPVFNRFRTARVLVIGDVMLDEYVVGSVTRMCPEAPVPVLNIETRYAAAGGAANVALNVAGLAGTAKLVGMAALDTAGLNLRRLLRERSVQDEGLVDSGDRGTISKTRIIAGHQQICRIDHEVINDATGPVLDKLIATAKRLIAWCSVVILSDYAKGTLTGQFTRAAIAFARQQGRLVIVDPKSKTFEKYHGCAVITPNVAEASLAADVRIDSESSLYKAGNVLLNQLPGTSVLITRGPDGMALFEPGCKPVLVPTFARRVFDVVGAGDTAVATLAVALAGGIPMRDAVAWANLAAGIVVEKQGTNSVSVEDLFGHEESTQLISSFADCAEARAQIA